MQRPLQITFHGVEHSDAVEQRIRVKAGELEHLSQRITSLHVTIDQHNKRHHHGNLYAVRIDLEVPGKTIVIGRGRPLDQAHEDLYVAVRDAFDAAARQLEDWMRRRRGGSRHSTPATAGR